LTKQRLWLIFWLFFSNPHLVTLLYSYPGSLCTFSFSFRHFFVPIFLSANSFLLRVLNPFLLRWENRADPRLGDQTRFALFPLFNATARQGDQMGRIFATWSINFSEKFFGNYRSSLNNWLLFFLWKSCVLHNFGQRWVGIYLSGFSQTHLVTLPRDQTLFSSWARTQKP
jgi:hypothetical protein